MICVSYCPLSSKNWFSSVMTWKREKNSQKPPYLTNQACPPPGLLCPLHHGTGTPDLPHTGRSISGASCPELGTTEEKRSTALNTGQVRRLLAHTATFLSEFLVIYGYAVLRVSDTHLPLFKSQVSNVSENHGL